MEEEAWDNGKPGLFVSLITEKREGDGWTD